MYTLIIIAGPTQWTLDMCLDTTFACLDGGGVDHVCWRDNGDSTSVVVAGVSHSLQTWEVGPGGTGSEC
jgi:hypothetical protein